MSTPMYAVMSESTACTLRTALRSRREQLMECWLKAHTNNMHDGSIGTPFWARLIQRVNDAAIECGFGY